MTTTVTPKHGDLRVWWIPQVPMTAFFVPVGSLQEGVKIMDVLADYDRFQFEHRVKPDYSNVGGIHEFDAEDHTDSPDGSWIDWFDEETGEADPVVYLLSLSSEEEPSS